MATTNGWNNQVAAAKSVIELNSGTNNVSISTDAAATSVNVGTGAAVKTVIVGSTNGASTSTLQSGTGALNVTATNGALTVNSGTGVLAISNDASATTVNIATGAAAKVATLGSTNGASSLALKYGTADFSLASATGNVIVAQDAGQVTMPLQPFFEAYLSAPVLNVTGNGEYYTIVFDTEVFDQAGNYDHTTGLFTAPVAGKYFFTTGVQFQGLTAAGGWVIYISLNGGGGPLSGGSVSMGSNLIGAVTSGTGIFATNNGVLSLAAGDTVRIFLFVRLAPGSTVVDLMGGAAVQTWFSGFLMY